MKKATTLLSNFYTNKKVKFSDSGFWNRDEEVKEYADRQKTKAEMGMGPWDWDEISRYRKLNRETSQLECDFIPKELYNTKFKVGDFELTVRQSQHDEVTPEEDRYDWRGGCREMHCRKINRIEVYVNNHGRYDLLYRLKHTFSIQMDETKAKQTNWGWIKIDKPGMYILKNILVGREYTEYENIRAIFDDLDISELELTDPILPIQPWWAHSNDEKIKRLADFTQEDIDYKYFIELETKDGVYKPEKPTIDRILYFQDYSTPKIKFPKTLLKDMGIHTVHLRGGSHFRVASYFDMEGITIKGPKNVIETYNYEEYCKDDAMLAKIAEGKRIAKAKRDAEKHNSLFTLTLHGKVIMADKHYNKIMSFLESYVPSDVMDSKGQKLEDKIINSVKPVFDEYDINLLWLDTWGRYYKYECAGEEYSESYVSEINEHLDSDVLANICDLYDSEIEIGLTKNLIESNYGYPDRGGSILGVERKNGKLSVIVNDYDPE